MGDHEPEGERQGDGRHQPVPTTSVSSNAACHPDPIGAWSLSLDGTPLPDLHQAAAPREA